MKGQSKRIAVAMSGGVDSSVTAALLLQEGHEVIGMTMCTREGAESKGAERFSPSCHEMARITDASGVAKKLGIPFHVIDVKRDFDRHVVDYFCSEYARGRTPNPCIVCNRDMKFGRLWREAQRLGCELIATGHYARLEYDQEARRYVLKKGMDARKDQSYVLFALSQDQLRYTRFPLGNLCKDGVKATARDLGIHVSDGTESQDICFTRGADYRCFLERRLKKKMQPGPIVDREGRILGTHKGISAYTIGQRRGLGVPAGHPLYVIDLDGAANRVIVGPEEETFQEGCVASGLNWIAVESLNAPQQVKAKIRYNHPGVEATVHPVGGDRVLVRFRRPQQAVTPGQAVVFYQGDRLFGGGWIERDTHV